VTNLHILNLGAGVQSTELYMMSQRGEIQPFDYAITSDTQDEFGGEHRPPAGWSPMRLPHRRRWQSWWWRFRASYGRHLSLHGSPDAALGRVMSGGKPCGKHPFKPLYVSPSRTNAGREPRV